MKLKTSILALLGAIALGSATAQTTREPQTMLGRDKGVLDHCTGNPVIPAYLADATIVYDQTSNRFYAYGTNDGAGLDNVFPIQYWWSEDCMNWHNSPLQLPQEWHELCGTKYVWAPSFIYNPATRKYYLMYGIDTHTFIAKSDNPDGPWEDANAVAPGKYFYRGYDAQFFLDDDLTMYLTTDNGFFKIMKLAFDDNGNVSIDNTDPRFDEVGNNEFIGDYHYKTATGLRNMFEASFIYKRGGLYYLMWSFQGCEEYNVRYAVSESIVGPWRDLNGSMDYAILERDDLNGILGPGHHSMFDYDGRTFIAYHRQHYPFVDSKRQTCIDEVFFNADGSIREVMPTHRGVKVKANARRYDGVNLALGCPTLTSSNRIYDNSHNPNRYRATGAKFTFSGQWAVDENYGTHWDPGLDVENPWIIIDLGKDQKIGSIETLFEFTNRRHNYKLEVLPSSSASSLEKASSSTGWQMFADNTAQGVPQSPVKDTSVTGKPMKGRFVRLTITAADLPYTADGNDPVNARNAPSVFEIRVFK